MIPTLTDDVVAGALGDFLRRLFTSVEVVQSQVNRVPEPATPDHIVFTHMRRQQMSTTTHEYDGQTSTVARSNTLEYQIDIYGPNSTDNAQVISTLFRDTYGCEFFARYRVQPLYCDDGQQMPLVNGEYQYENRWTMKAVLQGNPAIVTPMEFASIVAVEPVELS